MSARKWQSSLMLLLAMSLTWLTGCHNGISQNPSYFPWLLPTGDVIPTHAKPPGNGYYANFDPYAIHLEVRPLSTVNPVQTQHVIVATVYSNDKPLRKRRIEWMVEGVGNIVEVDESGFLPGRGYKKDNKYAVSYTNYGTHRITRGNTDPRDDFELRPGQTWCVVSSAVEGDTYVTVYAPGIYNWDRRKVVVNCKWVDAEWQFPVTAQARSGTQHVLTTRVFRHTDKEPLANYKVRYRIIDGPPAEFIPNRTQEAVVVSDLSGNAQVAVAQIAPQLGLSRVEIEIIRPPDPTKPSGAGVVVAKAFTTIEWLAPKVDLNFTGPPRAAVGEDIPYTLIVTNNGKIESQPITVTNTIPAGLDFVSSTPPAVPDGRNRIWTLSPLKPGESHTIQMIGKALQTGTINNCAVAVSEDGLRDEKCVVTQITRPAISVDVRGPQAGVVGVPLSFDVTFSNPGSGPAENVTVRAELSDGLEPQGLPAGQENSRVVTSGQGSLGGGESRVIPLPVVPRKPGRQTMRVTVTADGGLTDVGEATVIITQPQIDVKLNGPRSRYTDRRAEWNIHVINLSNVPIDKVLVRDQLPPGLIFANATDGGVFNNGEVVWDLGTLAAGKDRVVQLTTVCGNTPGVVNHKVVVTSDYGLRQEDSVPIEIKALPAALRLEMVDIGDPVQIGKRVLYEIEVTNTGAKPAKQIEIVARIPNELKLVKSEGGPVKINGQAVTFEKLPELPPGQTAKFKIEVEAVKAGDVRFETRLTSDILQGPVTETESTTIVDPNAPANPAPGAGQPPPALNILPPRPASRGNPPADNNSAAPTLRRAIVPSVPPPPVPKS